jgi:hypothetical protein
MQRASISLGIHANRAYPHPRRRAHHPASNLPPVCHKHRAEHHRPQVKQREHKSLFASFSSEKEDSSFFEKKEAKKLLFLVLFITRVTF